VSAGFPIKYNQKDKLDDEWFKEFDIETQLEISGSGKIYGTTKIKLCHMPAHLGVILIELQDGNGDILYKEDEKILIEGKTTGCREITENWSHEYAGDLDKINKVSIQHTRKEKIKEANDNSGVLKTIIGVGGTLVAVFLNHYLK
jgi:hypothetical protein